MESKIVFFGLLVLNVIFFHSPVLSDEAIPVSQLQNEIVQLKAQVQDLISKVEFVLKTCVRKCKCKCSEEPFPASRYQVRSGHSRGLLRILLRRLHYGFLLSGWLGATPSIE